MTCRKKKVLILGSTGSIGINTLRVLSRFPDCFEVVGLTAHHNWRLLAEQAKLFRPKYVAIGQKHILALKLVLNSPRIKILAVERDLAFLTVLPDVDIVVIAMSGRLALEPFLCAAQAGKHIAPANKEALVIAGEMIMAATAKSGARIIPVDSEQSAIFQCLQGNHIKDLKKIYLTASGGALYNTPRQNFDALTIADILNHPRWKMGKKITVDSATLMNKGFEVLEAQRLFAVDVNKVDVVIHPQAIVHSMVSFKDGSVLAQLGMTDMRLPIQYALTYPQRWDSGLPALDFTKLGQLTFAKPDLRKFPCLGLALQVARVGGTLPTVLNAADEEAVQAFLAGQIRFSQIFKVVDKVVQTHKVQKRLTLKMVQDVDAQERLKAKALIAKIK
ncbi:MAG: 1-deoxy-D-xylulose-5-phosphate reductoisomerase [Candidatus Omnitrophica bacterium]|nr:1-deoxy-D-xylulose-5-phosphate reductoisomerase [Candidatus Omnitrophota bacterium]